MAKAIPRRSARTFTLIAVLCACRATPDVFASGMPSQRHGISAVYGPITASGGWLCGRNLGQVTPKAANADSRQRRTGGAPGSWTRCSLPARPIFHVERLGRKQPPLELAHLVVVHQPHDVLDADREVGSVDRLAGRDHAFH